MIMAWIVGILIVLGLLSISFGMMFYGYKKIKDATKK